MKRFLRDLFIYPKTKFSIHLSITPFVSKVSNFYVKASYKKVSLHLFLLLLSSCTLHPRYERPITQAPPSWRVSTENIYDQVDIAFWKQFKDSVLDELIDIALKNNQDLYVAIYRVKEFEAIYKIVSSQLYPQINISGGANRSKFSTNQAPVITGVSPENSSFNLIGNASYLVDIWGKIRSASESAYADLLAEVQNRRGVILALVTTLASSYVLLRQYDAQILIAEETKATRDMSYYLATIRYQLGLTSDMPVQQALSEVESAQVQIDQIKISIAIMEDLISYLIGRSSEDIPRGRTLEALLMPPRLPTYIPSELVSQRIDVLQAEQKLISANANIGVAQAKFFPEFNLMATGGAESSFLTNFFSSSSSVWEFGATLLQEIFTGGRLTGGLKLAKAQKMEMLHAYQNAILNGFKEANDALIAHKISRDLVDTQRERVATYKEYFRLATYQYNEGLTDYLTYLDAERRVFEAELAYAQAVGYSFTTYIDIYRALGGPWVNEADQFSQTHDPAPLH